MRKIFVFLCGLSLGVSVQAQSPVFTTLYTFQGGADGSMQGGYEGPMPTGVTLSKNGKLYGVTYAGGAGNGTVFELSPASGGIWTKTILHDFAGPDGANPDATLVFDSSGTLYGTTQDGGTDNDGGTVFAMTPPAAAGGTWTESVVYSFDGVYNTPRTPFSGVIVAPDGALYGTTYTNACSDCLGGADPTGGTVFQLTPPSESGGAWAQHTILNFLTDPVGNLPYAGVIRSGGALYGTTSLSGNCGTVYELVPTTSSGASWSATELHAFGSTSGDGCFNVTPLTAGSGGVLYGVTAYGGSSVGNCPGVYSEACGTVFQLTPPAAPGGTWEYSVIWNFTGADGDGSEPSGSLVLGEG
ncbi:MAG: choice-of-anchor tandem repeat GloVer-containing protein, partial [Verrucomicrobiota bacterium]